jgi:hypothetical protein
MIDGARDGLIGRGAAAALPFRSRAQHTARRQWRPAILLPWAAAATLAVTTGYLWVQPGPQPSILSPVTLRPASRGADPIVPLGQAGTVTLAMDLSGATWRGPLRYELLRSTGELLASGEAEVPPAGAPLLLSIPSTLLSEGNSYMLRVHGSSTEGLTQDDYRFRVGTP